MTGSIPATYVLASTNGENVIAASAATAASSFFTAFSSFCEHLPAFAMVEEGAPICQQVMAPPFAGLACRVMVTACFCYF
jgi:hypothetical protein